MTDQQHEGEFVTFVGGPMDGCRMPVRGWATAQRATGVAHICENASYGPGGRDEGDAP